MLRYDKLYIDNTPYIFDEDRNSVVRFYAPEHNRPLSRNNYSSMEDVPPGDYFAIFIFTLLASSKGSLQ